MPVRRILCIATIGFAAVFFGAFLLLARMQTRFYILPREAALFRGEFLATSTPIIARDGDIGPQEKLPNPPKIVKAVYATNWTAGNPRLLKNLIDLIGRTELNAMVVDVKDYTGFVAYNTALELPKKYNAIELRIPQFNKLVKRLHDAGIYVIARIAVFEDQRLPLARNDLALIASSTGKLWRDNKGLLWLDTAAREVWDYNLSIAQEALDRGVDEVNFDYIRFASDGPTNDIRYPLWDEKTLKTKVLRDFFSYAREKLPSAKLSADLFGLVTVDTGGLGIGQSLLYALPYFDAIAPMVYPSHYYAGFHGFPNPAAHPYEVVRYSMESAFAQSIDYESAGAASASTTVEQFRVEHPAAVMRPWIQDFNLGALYGAKEVRAEIQALADAASSTARADLLGGWMLWNPSNRYTEGALLPE